MDSDRCSRLSLGRAGQGSLTLLSTGKGGGDMGNFQDVAQGRRALEGFRNLPVGEAATHLGEK